MLGTCLINLKKKIIENEKKSHEKQQKYLINFKGKKAKQVARQKEYTNS